jgi:hypothetical protein
VFDGDAGVYVAFDPSPSRRVIVGTGGLLNRWRSSRLTDRTVCGCGGDVMLRS